MTVAIQGHTYEMGKKEFNNFIKTLKKSLKKQPMIIAVEKAGHAEMRNDIFKSQKELTEAIKKWNEKGYLVKYFRGI